MGSLKIQEAFWFADNMPSIYPLLKEKLMVVSFKILFMGVINMIMDKLEDVLEVLMPFLMLLER
jgi:hypothetical protein